MENEKTTVFLGGTCASSTWREELIPMLGEHVEYYNPVVPNWTKECQAIEDFHRENDDICLYVITPEGEGFYSFVEAIDDSNKRPDQTILCVLNDVNGASFSKHNNKCALKTMMLASENGAMVAENLEEVAELINGYTKVQPKEYTK